VTALQRQWRRFRRLPAVAQAAVVIAIAGAYTVALVAVLGGGDAREVRTVVQPAARQRPLTPLERQVSRAVRGARLFQQESSDVPAFRRPEIASVRCKAGCRVVYTVSVPGRGRILFQQLEMVRAIFRDTSVSRVALRVVRVAPHGPAAIRKAEEETPAGFPLVETTCDRSGLGRRIDWRTQKEAQAALSRSCTVRAFDQGRLHRGGRGGAISGPG
jgi:hypothetical protein